jgi:hypothetical protein
MSQLNRKALKKLILKEFRMMGMAPMGGGMLGDSPYSSHHDHVPPVHVEFDHDDHRGHGMHGGHKGALSMEDCCKAVLCLIECCDCQITKQKIRQCCEDILSDC